jgi:hypothetical protein
LWLLVQREAQVVLIYEETASLKDPDQDPFCELTSAFGGANLPQCDHITQARKSTPAWALSASAGRTVADTTWRDAWPVFRVSLIDETARCLANQRARSTLDPSTRWDGLSGVEQKNLVEGIASVFLAMDEAMSVLGAAGRTSRAE